MIDPNNRYTQMQRREYAMEASKWSMENKNPVVGAWDWHNEWADYELLFKDIPTKNRFALDFGCGPGRMIQKYAERFYRIDGADIDETNLKNARRLLKDLPAWKQPTLYHTNGVDLQEIEDCQYNVVYSAICLQHIPVHEIRYNLFKEFYRVLDKGGWLTAQMGYGETTDSRGVGYYNNVYHAEITNGGCDVNVTMPGQLQHDLESMRFVDFQYVIRPCGPNDWHPNWIWFRARKPGESHDIVQQGTAVSDDEDNQTRQIGSYLVSARRW